MMPLLRKIFVSFFIVVISSLSAFAEGGYANTLMSLRFAPVDADTVNVIVATKSTYNETISVTKKDALTYILTLHDTDNLASNPDLSKTGQISSVSVRTMPATDFGKGYTRVTIKTSSPINIDAKNTIYKPDRNASEPERIERQDNEERYKASEYPRNARKNTYSSNSNYASQSVRREYNTARNIERTEKTRHSQPSSSSTVKETQPKIPDVNSAENTPAIPDNSTKPSGKDPTEQILLILGAIFVVTASIFFYLKAKDKMTDLAGERLDIDVEEEAASKNKKKETSQKKRRSVTKTISELDKKFSRSAVMPRYDKYSNPSPVMSSEKSTDDMNIVDLDALFNEQKSQSSSEENDALEDFLSEFSFDESDKQEQNEETQELYEIDEEEYKEIINNNKLKFSKDDIDCIGQIINSEISSDTLDNVDKYLVSNPIKQPQRKSLDEMAAMYTITQGITFTQKDINALNKIMNVELDQDFVTNLRTDPERTKAMEKQILEFQNSELKKPSEIVTLKVADLLPNLSDVLANPSKYEEAEPQKVYADESSLLKNIENVSFKPFDDGTRKFEIVNDFSDEPQEVIELYSEDFLAEKNAKNNMKDDEIKEPKPVNTKMDEQPAANIPNKAVENIRNQQRESDKKPLRRPIKAVDNKVQNNTKIQENNNPENNTKQKEVIKCIMNGQTYTVLSSVAITKNIGCHLAKNNTGYSVLSYSGSEVALLKTYTKLNSEKIQARLSDKLSDGTYRFIVRIGNNKFVADLKKGCLNYVMDL